MAELAVPALIELVNHVFLPPQLPQQNDSGSFSDLMKLSLSALQAFSKASPAHAAVIGDAIRLFTTSRAIHSLLEDNINDDQLRQALEDGKPAFLLVRAQNAGILITYDDNGDATVEQFELSAHNEAVMTTQGRLVRTFPGSAVRVKAATRGEIGFQTTFAHTMSVMCHQSADEMQPQTKKTGQENAELRDTTHSGLISELFVGGFLTAAGAPVSVASITKHTREDVLWNQVKLPWRRSPAWLLIKIALQLTLTRHAEGSTALFKQVMVFLMARILNHAVIADLPGELLFVMNAKLARRLEKLGHDKTSLSTAGSVLQYIHEEMQTASQKVSRQWTAIQQRETQPIPISKMLSKLDLEHDSLHSLPGLDNYIRTLRSRPQVGDIVEFAETQKLAKLDPASLPSPRSKTTDSDYTLASLQQFEVWISSQLEQWAQSNIGQGDVCSRLRDLLEEYHTIAERTYLNNPEAISSMLLTLVEMWIVCDRVAVQTCELLRQYDPDIPQAVFQNLLLPSTVQMERLHAAEVYLLNRKAKSAFPATDLFALRSPRGFVIKYFDQSKPHQDILQQITAKSKRDREAKLSEFVRLKAEHRRLITLHHQSSCDLVDVLIDTWEGVEETESQHSGSCRKCGYLRQAQNLEITIFEEPLPESNDKAKAIVFELRAPPWFPAWRDARGFLLRTVLQGNYSTPKPRAKYPLFGDRHLSSFKIASSFQRIELLSQDKPNIVAHYGGKKVGTSSESDICRKSGVSYQYYDSTHGVFFGELEYNTSSQRMFVYKLPEPLSRFIFRPSAAPDGPPPNLVIASQDQCPDSMALDEYKELSTLPLGHKIQWQNILLQLTSPSVDFKKSETTLVFLQCLYQTGPSNGTALRAAHTLLLDDTFAATLLQALDTALQRVKENWESSQALCVFIAIAARVLSLSRSNGIQRCCAAFLSNARQVALNWVNLLRDKSFVAKSVEVALICAMTFDVDDAHLATIMVSPQNVSTFVQLSVTLREGRLVTSTDTLFPLLRSRFSRLMHRAYPLIATNISGIDLAIQSSWSAFRPGAPWQAASPALDYWLVTKTAAVSDNASLIVHYNLITGELLVNGLPMDRPPKKYEDHPLYQRLFGQTAVEVMPSTAGGMQFSAKLPFHGNTVNLGWSDKGDLLVQTASSAKTYEIIPARLLQDEFPAFFGNEFVHFYDSTDRSTGDVVEFRPVGTPWSSDSPGTCQLRRCGDSSHWKLTRLGDGDALIGLKSETAKAIASILRPLAHANDIHNVLPASRITEKSRSAMDVEIPALRLGFSMDKGDHVLRSHQYRDMQIDCDQSLDTLIGFKNKLMLRSSSKSQSVHRMVLFLESRVSYDVDHLSPPHTKVSITRTAPDIRVHAFNVDVQLGRLTGAGSLESKLFLVLLHALTTSCLPDPLTQRTGTEQALAELNCAAVRSFDRLTERNILLLEQIAELTPGRVFCPRNKRVMQQVNWNHRLSFLAQHGGFFTTVESIFEQAKRSEIFYPESKLKFPSLNRIDGALLQRDSIRSSSFRISGSGAEDHTVLQDVQYNARDGGHTERSQHSFLASSFVFNDIKELQWSMASMDHLWNLMSRLKLVSGRSVDLAGLRYDAKVLSTWQEYVLEHLPGIHAALKDRQQAIRQKYSMMMWLSTIGFSKTVDLQILQTLATLFTCESVHGANILSPVTYNPSRGKEIMLDDLRSIFNQHTISYRRTIVRESGEKLRKWEDRDAVERNRHQQKVTSAVGQLSKSFQAQGCPAVPFLPTASTFPDIANFVKADQAMHQVKEIFKACSDNFELHAYLRNVETAVRACVTHRKSVVLAAPLISPPAYSKMDGCVSNRRLFAGSVPPAVPAGRSILNLPQRAVSRRDSAQQHQSPMLGELIDNCANSAGSSQYKKGYVHGLADSRDSLHSQESNQFQPHDLGEQDFVSHLGACSQLVDTKFASIVSAVTTGSVGFLIANQFPRLSPMLFLSQLGYANWSTLSPEWQCVIVDYGLALTALQRAERMLQAFRKDGPQSADLTSELQHCGHSNWDPLTYPESLLIEVENGIMIRDVQESIASEMRTPKDGLNSTMQLNMGQGKSSLIVPIVACALADRSQLVRVIVAKPQSKQMADMLKAKLGGAVGRRIYYMPFSRSLKLDRAAANTVFEICRECMLNGGILLVQPEHILSSKLMAPECFTTDKEEIGRSLMHLQDFFDSSSRDIVDESDENFSVKFELIYTMGTQRPIEGSPDRWMYIQQVMELVRVKAPAVMTELGSSAIEIHDGANGIFPRIRILKPEAEGMLLHLVARHICDLGLDGFPLGRQTKIVQDGLYEYMMQLDPTSDQIDVVENGGPAGFWIDSTKATILLLRGLLGGGVLAFVFGQKRWRVNFGLADRNPPTKLSVPFRAKDSPTPRSEFSHPDVVIMLTSLCYYYGGLDDEDLFIALGRLMESDQADSEYQTWVSDADQLRPAFLQLQGINLKDRKQCASRLFPSLRFGKSVVDYYLSRIVFPKEMKEFPSKLSASGWDIGKVKAKPTTGFSGTSDSRILLPLDVQHLDLEEQKHTNALVLQHLLRPENTVEEMPSLANSRMSDAERILSVTLGLSNSPEVILDVGAQILELDNLQVARKWLQMRDTLDDTKEAVVFVNIDDELSVVDRKGRVELLQTSSFASRLDVCLVFLDEAHTRGIDLKLPADYRAAVTLGANLTKDRLVQACMRLRKLGQGQRVVFLVSEEIRTKIQDCTAKTGCDLIQVLDVLQWTISETCAEMHRSMPLWSVQGERYLQQEKLWNACFSDGQTHLTKERAERFLAPEAQSIEERYRPRQEYTDSTKRLANSSAPRLRQIFERCQMFENLKFNSSSLQEEQERELSPEIEQERQIQKAAPAKPEDHDLAFEVRSFALQGTLVTNSQAYFPAFEALRDSSGAKSFNVTSFAGNLMVTADFARTVVKSGGSYRSDQFQRSVQWIISLHDPNTDMIKFLMIISPYEANKLIWEMKDPTKTALHLYKPRCNSGFQTLDRLDLYTVTGQRLPPTVPRMLAVQLGLFAGQLYISSYEDYQRVCTFLSLTMGATPPGWDVAPDGFIIWDGKNRRGRNENPVQFIKFLMTTVRRNGQGIAKTDMGGLLEGKLFQRSDFEDRK